MTYRTAFKYLAAPPILFVIAWSFSGCSKLQEGIDAYYQGNYAAAVKDLQGIASDQAKQNPVIKISTDANTTLDQALPAATEEAFEGWQAYSGSLLGLGRVSDGCTAIQTALRPITVIQNNKVLPQKVDPREGDFWEAEVMTLRSWWVTIPCSSSGPVSPLFLLPRTLP